MNPINEGFLLYSEEESISKSIQVGARLLKLRYEVRVLGKKVYCKNHNW